MTVVAEVPGLYQKIRTYADAMAQRMGVDPKAIYAYFNATAHFPQSVQELNTFGSQVDPTYGYPRRDPNTGAWRFIGGGQPTPGLTDQQRAGFAGHYQANAGDYDIERYQQVDPRGTVFGGSWDQSYNQAHPELAGKSGFDTPLGASLGLGTAPAGATGAGATARTAGAATQSLTGGTMQAESARSFDQNNYVAPVDPSNPSGPYVSYVNGVPNTYASRAEAEQDYNTRTGATGDTGTGSTGSTGSTGATGSTGTGSTGSTGSGTTGGNTGINPELLGPANQAANNAAMIAYYNARLALDRDTETHRDENEKQRLAQEAARDAWNKTYQSAQLTGTLNGASTLEGTKQGAELTGYVGPGYATQANQAFQNLPPAERTGEAAARIWQNVAGLSADEAAQMNEAGHQYYAATGQAMPDAVAAQNLSRITGGRVTGTGAQQSIAYQHQQNQDAISALTLLSNLRGPENAFAYANTLANLPDSVRQTIQAMTQNIPMAARNPAQAGVLGDATGQAYPQAATQQIQGGQMQGYGPGAATMDWGRAAVQPESYPLGTGPRTTDVLYRASGVPQQDQQALQSAPRIAGVTGAGTLPSQYGQVAGSGAATQQPRQYGGNALVAAPGALPAANTGQPGTMRAQVMPYANSGQPAYGPRTQPTGLPASSAWSPTDYNQSNVYARKLMLAGYEQSGQDKEAVMDAYTRSLPTATGPRTGRLRAA